MDRNIQPAAVRRGRSFGDLHVRVLNMKEEKPQRHRDTERKQKTYTKYFVETLCLCVSVVKNFFLSPKVVSKRSAIFSRRFFSTALLLPFAFCLSPFALAQKYSFADQW